MTTTTSLPGYTITVETVVDDETARAFYKLYLETFGELATRAAARQVLDEDEFMADMVDPRVFKYLARDQAGNVVGMCTLTSHLQVVPWISPEYFAHHYPDHAERQAIYYLGFIMVAHRHRRTRLFQLMISRVVERLVAERAVCSYDICGYNNTVLRLADNIESLLVRVADVDVEEIDAQRYYTATFTGSAPAA